MSERFRILIGTWCQLKSQEKWSNAYAYFFLVDYDAMLIIVTRLLRQLSM